MACANIENLFIKHAGLIRNDVSKQIEFTDFYLKELGKEPWKDGQGEQYQYPIYERSLPTSPVTFSAWASSVGDGDLATDDGAAGGPCSTPGQNIDSFGITLRNVSLKKAALNSPDICLEDLRFDWEIEDQVKNVTRVLSENSRWVWTNAYQDEYIAACGHKMIANPALAEGAVTFPAAAATSVLTWGILESIYEQLSYLGGHLDAFQMVDDMTPVYALVGDRFVFEDLKRADDNTRSDFHYSSQADKMLGAPGLNGVYRGFRNFTVQFPPRYDFVAGAYVRRLPYESFSATRGKGWEVSAEYKNAEYTVTTVFLKSVLTILVPKPRGAIAGMTYNPQTSWTGDFRWVNIPDRECNVDGNIGFFRALYAYGAKVERPDLGFAVMHLRCDRNLDLRACS